MKFVKMLQLLAVAAAALTAFTGTAAATTATSPKGTVYTGAYKAESEGAIRLKNSYFGTITCMQSIAEGKVEQHGASTTTKGKLTTLTFTQCTGGTPTSPVAKPGTLEAHATAIKGTDADGTLTSTGAEVIVHNTLAGTCIFTTSNTDIGTGSLTSTTTTGGNATLDIGSSLIPQSGSPFCGPSATWEGSYKVVTPSTLYIDA